MSTFFKTLTTSNTPTQITGIATQFTTATFFAYSGFTISGAPMNNAQTMYLGVETGRACITLPSGGYFNWSLQAKNSKDDFSNFYMNGSAGDGIYVVYYK